MRPVTHRLRRLAALLLALAVATPFAAAQAAGGVDAEGPITAIVDSTITVQGLTFRITPETDIHDDDDAPLPFSALTVGLVVDVDGDMVGGTLVAFEVEVEDDQGDEVEAEGLVLARTDSSLTVGGLTFGVDAATVVVDDDDQPVGYSAVTVGVRVEVEGRLLPDGSLLASRIELDDDGGDDGDLEIEGLISALTADSLTVRGVTFALTPETVVVGDDDQPLTLADLAVGLRVEVDGRYLAGVLTATRVELEDFDDAELELTGAIEALTDTSLTVAGTLFAVTDQTVVLDDNRLPIPFASLALGETVEVKGRLGADGRRVATRIKREDDGPGGLDAEIEARAALDAVTDSVAVVLGRPFVVTAATQVRGTAGQPVDLASLPVGGLVELRARREADGRLVALVIEQEDGAATDVRLRGPVTFVSADSVSVLGVAFDAAAAVVTGADGQPATLADVAVGQEVRVTGMATDVGFTAAAVQILRAAQARGVVATATGGTLTLAGVTVSTTSATLFVDEAGAPVAPSSVTAGTDVRALGTLSAAGALTASRVVVLAPSATVASAPAPRALAALEAPFPNPAAARATVRFSLDAAATAAVEVVDALGRTVLRVEAGALAAGTHEARLETQRLPAGVYLVRLTADGRPAGTRSLTVVR